MYINIVKILQIIGLIVGLTILGYGIYSTVMATNAQLQIAAILFAIFGLQLIWFILWITKK